MIGAHVLGSACLAGGIGHQRGLAGNAIAIDASVTEAHGVYVGDPTLYQPSLLSGDPDPCVRFETESDYVWIGRQAVYSFASNIFTLEFWYRPTTENAYEGIVSKIGDGFEYAVFRSGSAVYFEAYTSAGAAVYSTSYTLVDTSQHYYAWAADGANARLYTDLSGVITLLTTVAKSGASMSATSSALKLGVASGIAPGLLAKSAAEVVGIGFTEAASLSIIGSTDLAASETVSIGFGEVASLEITGLVDLATNDNLAGACIEFSVVVPDDQFFINIVGADTVGIGVVEPQDITGEVDTNESLMAALTEGSAASISDLGAGRPALGTSKTRLGPHHIPTRRHP